MVCSGNCPNYSLISQEEFLQTVTTCYLFKKPAVLVSQKEGKQTKKEAATKTILLAEMVKFSILFRSATSCINVHEKVHYKNAFKMNSNKLRGNSK